MVTIRFRLLLLVAALSLGLPAGAQLHRGARTVVRGGLLEKPDSLKGRRDSLRLAGLVRQIDSTDEQLAAQLDQAAAEYAADSAAVADLRSDDLHYLDSLALARFDAAQRGVDTTTKRKVYKKGWFMSDSMSLSKVCWISTVVPGYGQIYNKQYWKLPILYGLVGTGLGLYRREPLAHARAGRPPVQDDPQQHAASGLPGDHDRLVHLLHRRRGRELLDQRRVERQEGHHAGLHLPRSGTDLQQKLLESAFRHRRIRLDDLLHRLEQPRLPTFQKGLQSATCATTTGATATSASSSRVRCTSCRSSMRMSTPTSRTTTFRTTSR